MPPPADPWSSPDPGPPDPKPGSSSWPFALALVTALVLTAVVATAVVVGMRHPGSAAPRPAVGTSAGSPVSAPSRTPATRTTPVRSTSPTPVVPATPAATGSPTAAPVEPIPSGSSTPSVAAGPDVSLKTNTVYGVDLGKATTSCGLVVRRPKPPLPDKKLQPYLTQVVACLTKVFQPSLAVRGFTLEQPKVKTYHRTVDSPCGDFDQHGSPAYYCSTTRTIYWPDTVDDGREAYTFARLGYVGLLAHEFGHHVQATTGMLNAYAEADRDVSKTQHYALSRRLELQAQCLEGVFLHATGKELGVSAKDRAELRSWHGYTGDEDPPEGRKPDHGSSRAQWGWLERGLDSGDVGDCNTWTASARSVT